MGENREVIDLRQFVRHKVSQLPVEGVDLILGNDLAGGKVFLQPIIVDTPEWLKELSGKAEQFPSAFPVCVITRAQARNLQDVVDLSDSILASDGGRVETKVFIQPELMLPAGESVHKNHKSLQVGINQLAMFQKSDPSLNACVTAAVDKDSLPDVGVAFYWDKKVLMRR